MDKHTRGECELSTKEEEGRDSTKYAPERMYKGKLQRLYKVYN
jgi:hypothetical protein